MRDSLAAITSSSANGTGRFSFLLHFCASSSKCLLSLSQIAPPGRALKAFGPAGSRSITNLCDGPWSYVKSGGSVTLKAKEKSELSTPNESPDRGKPDGNVLSPLGGID